MFYRRWLKPSIDRFLAATGLVFVAPLMAALALVIRIRLGRPVFFRQTRIGLRERPFQFYKFRTMTSSRNNEGALLPDAERLTALGRVLRSSSLDELPQLWNVLKGDMSLIGPRPLLPQYLPRYSAFQRRRHEVKPGITGLAQVKGRNSLDWDDKFRLDVWYVDHLTAALDFQIILMTLAAVMGRRDVSRFGHATAPEFMGMESPNFKSPPHE